MSQKSIYGFKVVTHNLKSEFKLPYVLSFNINRVLFLICLILKYVHIAIGNRKVIMYLISYSNDPFGDKFNLNISLTIELPYNLLESVCHPILSVILCNQKAAQFVLQGVSLSIAHYLEGI